VPRLRLPNVPPSEMMPRTRLAAKFLAAQRIIDRNDRAGAMYEVSAGMKLMGLGYFTRGNQIGRRALSKGEFDQEVRLGDVEVDGAFSRRSQASVLIGQMKSTRGEGGEQIREAIGYAIVDQSTSQQTHTPRIIGGLLYAEPTGVDAIRLKVLRNVLECLTTGNFEAVTTARPDDVRAVLEANSQRLGKAVSKVKQTLRDDYNYVRGKRDGLTEEESAVIRADVKEGGGVDLVILQVPRAPEGFLQSLLANDIRTTESLNSSITAEARTHNP